MTLFTKLALYNTFIRLLLIGALWLVLPWLISNFNDQHTDVQLLVMNKQVLARIQQTGVKPFMHDTNKGHQNLLSEEYATIVPYRNPGDQPTRHFFNRQRTGTTTTDYRVLSHPIRVAGQLYILEVGKSLNEVRELGQTLSRLVLSILAGILILTFLIDLGYVHFLLRPLRLIISQKLRVIQEPGQFDFSPLPTTTRELSQLDEHINDLMHQLNATFMREKAFASQASHELLTPIAVLRTRFDNLIADEQTPPHVAIGLVESQQILLRLSKLVQKLLRLARIENHQYLKNDTVSIREVLQEVLENLEDRIVLKGIQVRLAIDEDIVLAPANQMLLYTLLLNLIGNAVRYNTEKGQLFIGRGMAGKLSILTIRDTGPGMKPEQVATLTEHGRLNYVTEARKSTESHNGIGLQLIRTIAQFHGIDLSVDVQPDQERPGQGTCVTLTFTDSR